jgi:hypothetical protein
MTNGYEVSAVIITNTEITLTVFKDCALRTVKETLPVYVTKPNWLFLCKELISPFFCKNHMKRDCAFC